MAAGPSESDGAALVGMSPEGLASGAWVGATSLRCGWISGEGTGRAVSRPSPDWVAPRGALVSGVLLLSPVGVSTGFGSVDLPAAG